MASFRSDHPRALAALLALAGVAAFSGCASHPVPTHGVYRVTWTATRASDHAALTAASTVVEVGGAATVRTDSRHPAENQPAFPSFTVRLSAMKTPGVLQLVSRASLLEAARNKKGKLRVTKRNIGALLPMRPGDTQLTNLPGDPVQIAVRLERK